MVHSSLYKKIITVEKVLERCIKGSYNKSENNEKCLYKKKCLIFVDIKSNDFCSLSHKQYN